MILFEREIKMELDMCEFYRQNYEDALDEIRNLKFRIQELEAENEILKDRLKAESVWIESKRKHLVF